MKKSLQNITTVYRKLECSPKIVNRAGSKTEFKTLTCRVLILLMATCFGGLLSTNKAFAATKKVTAVSYGTQVGSATYGTSNSVTYTITLTETGNTTPTPDNILLTWATTPSNVSVAFTSSTDVINNGTLLNPTFTPSGSAQPSHTILLTITTSGTTTLASSYGFTLKITDNNGGGAYSSTGLSLLVSQKTLTISGLSATDKTYDGTTTATLSGTAVYSGLVNGDVVGYTAAFASANVGSAIAVNLTLTGPKATNYILTQPGLTASITAATLTITASTQSKTYGSTLTSGTGKTAFSSSGLVNGQTVGSVTISYGTGAAASDATGTYTSQATPSAATGGTFSASNYTITYVAGNIVVTPATLTITADNQSITYGSSIPTLTATYTGFVNGDSQVTLVTTSATVTTTATSSSNATTYPITPSGAVLSNSNYTISYVNGTLTISKATLTISADNQYKVQGTANPTFTVSYSGFVNSDSQASIVTTNATVTSSPVAGTSSPAGTYTLIPSGAVLNNSNYTIIYVNGTLTIVAASYDWTGASSTNWTDPGNWTVNGAAVTSYPGFGTSDAVNIGVSASYTTITNFPAISSTSPISHPISLLIVGSNGGPSSLAIGSGAALTISQTMTVNSNVNLTVSGGGSLSVGGDFANSGTVTFGAGAVTFSNNFTNNTGGIVNFGTGLVTFNSTTGTSPSPTTIRSAPSSTNAQVKFINLAFGSGGHFLFKSTIGTGNTAAFSLAATGLMTMGMSTTVNVTNATFTLLSDQNGSAAVDVIPSSSTLNGTFAVQRFITGGGLSMYRGYRLLSSPVYTATSGAIKNISLAYLDANGTVGTTTYNGAYTGGPGTGFTAFNGNPTIYLYDETLAVNNHYFISGKHVGIYSITANTVTTVSNATGPIVYTSNVSIPAGNGFLMFFVGPNTRVTGSSSVPPIDATLTATGSFNQGNVPVNLWYTPSGGAGYLSYTASLGTTGAGYNMVGNPYASTIDLYKVLSNNPGIDVIYTLSPIGPSQSYTVYTQSGSSAPSTYYAVSGQGFIVHATGPSATLTFQESDKSATTQLIGSQLLMGTPKQDAALTGLYLKLEQDSLHYDYCGIYFRNDWSDAFENGDALYLSGNSISMASLTSDGKMAAVNHLHTYTNDSQVRLYTSAQLSGDYTLKIEGIRNIDTAYDIYLVDHYKQDSVNIRKTGAYAFSILKSDTASFGTNRFVLAFHKNPAYIYHLLNFTARQVAHSQHVLLTWEAQNEFNNNFTVERSNDGGKTFAVAGGLLGTGAGTYGLTDKNAMDGQNLYRLKSEDINNNVTYSQIVEVIISANGNADKIHLYPNPTSSIVNMDLLDKTNGNISYNITVRNSTGFIVKQVTSSQASWQTDVSGLLPGTYLIRVVNSKTQDLIAESKLIKL